MPPELIHLLTSANYREARVVCGVLTGLALPDPARVTCPACVVSGSGFLVSGSNQRPETTDHRPVGKFRHERAFQAALSHAALAANWLCFHPYDSRHSPAGYPDTTLVRSGRLIFAELKMPGQRPTPQQSAWLDALGQVREVSTHLWYPEDLPYILEVLR